MGLMSVGTGPIASSTARQRGFDYANDDDDDDDAIMKRINLWDVGMK